MATNRTKTLQQWIWAEDAPDVPAVGLPVPLVTYAESGLLGSVVNNGWAYTKEVDSASFNEMLQRLTMIAAGVEFYGGIPWCSLLAYPVGARVIGSDDQLYTASAASLNQDPTTAGVAYWVPKEVPIFIPAIGAAVDQNMPPAGQVEFVLTMDSAHIVTLHALGGTTFTDGETSYVLDVKGVVARFLLRGTIWYRL